MVSVVQLEAITMGVPSVASVRIALEALKRYESLPRSQDLRDALSKIGEDMEDLLRENQGLREIIQLQECRLRGQARGR